MKNIIVAVCFVMAPYVSLAASIDDLPLLNLPIGTKFTVAKKMNTEIEGMKTRLYFRSKAQLPDFSESWPICQVYNYLKGVAPTTSGTQDVDRAIQDALGDSLLGVTRNVLAVERSEIYTPASTKLVEVKLQFSQDHKLRAMDSISCLAPVDHVLTLGDLKSAFGEYIDVDVK